VIATLAKIDEAVGKIFEKLGELDDVGTTISDSVNELVVCDDVLENLVIVLHEEVL
jgi:hypothetical protein